MTSRIGNTESLDRRNFLRGAGGAFAASLLVAFTQSGAQQLPRGGTPESIAHAGVKRPLNDHEKAAHIASNSYPIRWIFKNRGNVGAAGFPKGFPECRAQPLHRNTRTRPGVQRRQGTDLTRNCQSRRPAA